MPGKKDGRGAGSGGTAAPRGPPAAPSAEDIVAFFHAQGGALDADALVRLRDGVLAKQAAAHPELDAVPPAAAGDAAARWARFREYLAASDCVCPKLEFGPIDEVKGAGVTAREPLCEGETFITVPTEMMLSLGTGPCARSPLAKALAEDPYFGSVETVALAVLLLAEAAKGDASPFAAYIGTLPESFSTPMFWTVEDLDRLGGSAAAPPFARAVRSLSAALQQYAMAVQALGRIDAGGCRVPSLRQFLWALGAVVTRQNQVPPGCLALIPGWDLCNHEEGAMATGFDEERSALVAGCMRAFGAGEEVHMCYGARDSLELLVYSGFVPEENAHHRAQLELEALAPLEPLKDKVVQSMASAVAAEEVLDPGGLTTRRWAFDADGRAVEAWLYPCLSVLVGDRDAVSHWLRCVQRMGKAERNTKHLVALEGLRGAGSANLARIAQVFAEAVQKRIAASEAAIADGALPGASWPAVMAARLAQADARILRKAAEVVAEGCAALAAPDRDEAKEP